MRMMWTVALWEWSVGTTVALWEWSELQIRIRMMLTRICNTGMNEDGMNEDGMNEDGMNEDGMYSYVWTENRSVRMYIVQYM